MSQSGQKQTEYWRASWIWYPEDANANPFVHRYFVKTFTLDEDVQSALLQFSADDAATVYVNGVIVRANSANWSDSNVYPITKMLMHGQNSIAVDVRQDRYAAGLLLEADITLKSGKRVLVKSDNSWHVAKEASDDWTKSTFITDEKWVTAQVLGAPPMGPWGKVPYHYFGPRTNYTIQGLQIPQSVVAGKPFSLSADIRFDTNFSHNVAAKFLIEKDGVEFYSLDCTPLQPSLQWEKGNTISLHRVTLTLSRFFPPGDYKVLLDIPFAQLPNASTNQTLLGELHVTNDKQAVSAHAAIKPLRGVPTIFVNGAPTFGMGYQGCPVDDKAYLQAQYADFARHDINVVKVIVAPFGNIDIWKSRDQFNFAPIDKYMMDVLDANPNAKINLVLPMQNLCPSWWKAQNPDQLVVFDAGKRSSNPSLFSPVWRRDAIYLISNIVRHIQSEPYRERVICYTLGDGAESQWLSWWNGGDVHPPNSQGDYSQPAQERFRAWLTEKYATDDALRLAWKNPDVTFQTAAIPDKSARLHTDLGLLQDPAKGRQVADYLLCISDTVADDLNDYGAAVKKISNGQILTAALYGHILDVASYYLAQDGGYLSAERVLDAPDIDIIAGPLSYSNIFRDIGGVSSIDFPPPASLAMHNKIWMNEEDIRTHLAAPGGYRYSVNTATDSIEVLRREFANVWCNRSSLYWYNLGTAHAWFDSPEIMNALGNLNQIAQQNLVYSRQSTAQIAVIVEPRSFAYTKPMMHDDKLGLMTDLMYTQRAQIARLGAPVDFHLASDFSLANMPDYKLYIFLNTLYLSAPERTAITHKLEKTGATALWFYAPGVITDNTLSIDAASQLIGITLNSVQSTFIPTIHLSANAFPDAPRQFGMTQSPGVLFYADDANAQTWGTLNIENKADLCAKTVSNWRSIYCSVPVLPAAILRQIAHDAGVHIYSNSNDALYACENFVAMHAQTGGEKTIDLPFTARVYDLFENKKISDATKVIHYQSAGHDTKMFRIEEVGK